MGQIFHFMKLREPPSNQHQTGRAALQEGGTRPLETGAQLAWTLAHFWKRLGKSA